MSIRRGHQPGRRIGWLRRSANEVALTTSRGSITVGEVQVRARRVAARILDSQPAIECLLVPSTDPAAFTIGLAACAEAGVAAVPWREEALPLDALADVVRPGGILRCTGDASARAPIERLDPGPLPQPRVGELIMMTSGSTGAPKGVALDFAQVALNALAAGMAMQVGRCEGWSIDLDIGLMSALSHLVMAWQFGLPLHHLTGRPPETVAALFAAGTLGFGGSPIQLVRLAEELRPGAQPAMLVSSGDFLSPAMIDRIAARFPATVVHKLYGLTELAGRFCCMPHELLMSDKAAVGLPLPGFEARVSGEKGEIGEIEAKSPLLTGGYYSVGGVFEHQPRDWFPTGDLGVMAEDGIITLVGRADDVLKVGGEKVDRHTIENALSDLLGPWEYCVLGVSHPLVGQCPALFIAPGSDGENPPSWGDIVAHLRARLPGRFVPGLMYRLAAALPRLANGKVDREVLKAKHQSFARLR